MDASLQICKVIYETEIVCKPASKSYSLLISACFTVLIVSKWCWKKCLFIQYTMLIHTMHEQCFIRAPLMVRSQEDFSCSRQTAVCRLWIYRISCKPIMIFLFKDFSSIKDNSIFVVKRMLKLISHFEARAISTRNGMDATCLNE